MKSLRVFGSLRGRGTTSQSVLARLVGVVQGGVTLLQPVAKLFAEFMAVPAQTAVDVAVKLAEAFGRTGIPRLAPEQRATLGLQVRWAALELGPEVATALHRTPEVEQAIGVKGQEVELRMLQEEELVGLAQAAIVAQGAIGDARMELQAWQYEAQSRLMRQLFLEFTSAQTIEQRIEIAGHAGPVLDALQKRLQALRDTKATNADEEAALQAQIEQVQNDVLLLQTMRAVKDGQQVDEDQLRQMALYYEGRMAQGGPAATGTGSSGAKGRGKGSGGKGGGGTRSHGGGTQAGGGHGGGTQAPGNPGGGTQAGGTQAGGGQAGGKKAGKGKKAPGPGMTLH